MNFNEAALPRQGNSPNRETAGAGWLLGVCVLGLLACEIAARWGWVTW